MSFLAIAPPGRVCEGDQIPTFAVVMACQDVASGKQAMSTYSWLLQKFGENYVFDSHLWQFDDWRTPLLQEPLAEESARADMIIVAAHANSPVPETIVGWTSRWVESRHDQDGALVLLLDSPSATPGGDSLARFLEKSARRAGMDFFSRSTHGQEQSPHLNRARTRMETTLACTLQEEIASAGRGNNRWWGLNE